MRIYKTVGRQVVHDDVHAQTTGTLASPALHADLEFLAELDRTLVQGTRRQAPARGASTSVGDLTAAITTWAQHWNADPEPFIWTATADDIIAKVQRGRTTLHQINTQTDH
ncbi:hypothetical protein M1247_00815 [Mycobacterium sp. 21AC1]|uniref:hypothetical protein n=1 Tax=[Mycobacterium] appelbergii TaxID=2939269 RepID=UPI0029391F99|nr:hypothetical protein [Mycobacterium sp. 21AC1]MDV3123442.1 hypothetical protein [Mycobacterium sp. 21AC1]